MNWNCSILTKTSRFPLRNRSDFQNLEFHCQFVYTLYLEIAVILYSMHSHNLNTICPSLDSLLFKSFTNSPNTFYIQKIFFPNFWMILIDFRNFYCSKNFKYRNFIINFAVNIFIPTHFWLYKIGFKLYQFSNCQTYV